MAFSRIRRSFPTSIGMTARSIPTTFRLQTTRPLSLSASRRADSHPNKQQDAQLDREKINTDANEYAKSGTDDTTAQNDEAAFGQNNPNPQDAKDKAGEDNKVNPLEASPGNPDIGAPTRESTGERKKGEIS
jgi:hypothetical protein